VGIRTDSVPKVALCGQAGKHKHPARRQTVTTTASAAGTRRYTGTYPADPAQVRHARAALAELLRGCPYANDAILIASEFATNSVVHSASRDGGEFTLRAEVHQDHIWIEVEDAGGPWHGGPRDDSRPHGFDVVAAIAGLQNWGVDGDTRGHTAWARLGR
jgi:anti-sigma regulatory factor (Ser/Thr protein kinase)